MQVGCLASSVEGLASRLRRLESQARSEVGSPPFGFDAEAPCFSPAVPAGAGPAVQACGALEIGCLVILVGLQSASLNGSLGIIRSLDEPNGRYGVEVDGMGFRAVRPANLVWRPHESEATEQFFRFEDDDFGSGGLTAVEFGGAWGSRPGCGRSSESVSRSVTRQRPHG